MSAASSTLSISQNYNSIVGSMKSLFKDNVEDINADIKSKSQIVLPKIDERRNSLTGSILRQSIRKSKSENAVNTAKKIRNGSIKEKYPSKQERKGSAPLREIDEREYFGSTLPPRALLKKLPPPAKEQDERMEQIRKDIDMTGDTLTSNGGSSKMNKELSITTSKDGKRRVRRRKEKKSKGIKEDGEPEFGISKRTRRKSVSRRGSISSKPGSRRPSITSIPGSLGMTMWLHKFLYKSRRSSSMKIKAGEPKLKEVVDENVDVVESSKIIQPEIKVNKAAESPIQKNEEPKNLDIKNKVTSTLLADNQIHSWGFLRNQLVSAKVREAFSVIKFELNGRKLQVLRELGEGGYSKVFEVFDEKRELYALKVVKIQCEETEQDMDRNVKKNLKIVDEKDIMKEIRILEMFQNCDRVINMLDYEMRSDVSLPLMEGVGNDDEVPMIQRKAIYILMERGETDLYMFSGKMGRDNSFTPAKIRYLWEGMLESLKYLHDKRVIHSDIKPANFLLVNGVIKIIDFGFARKLEPDEKYANRNYIAGTKDYLSPETLSCYVIEEGVINVEETKRRNVRVYLQSDIWSLGVILYQWIYGESLYACVPGGRVAKIQATISRDQIQFEPLQDLDLLDTLKSCLHKNPLKRASVEKLLAHPYLHPVHKRYNRKIKDT